MKKFYLILAALVAAMTVNAADWYISGTFQGWKHCNADYKFTETATAGVYTLTLPEYNGSKALSGDFLIVQSNSTGTSPDWNTKIGTNGSKIQVDVPYKYVSGAENFVIDGTVDDAELTLDTNKGTLLVTGAASENEYTDIYLIGDFGKGWSTDVKSYPLKLVEGSTNTYEGKYNLSAATTYFKMKAGSLVYGTGGSDVAVELGESYTAAQSGEAFSIGEGEYTFKFVLEKNADTGVLTVAGEQIVTYPETMNVIGNVNGATWAYDNVIAMTKDSEGVFSIENIAIGGELGTTFGYFSFCENGDATSWETVGKRYGATTKDEAPDFEAANPATLAIVQAADPFAFKVPEGNYNMTLDFTEMTLSLEKIAAPEPIVANGTIAAGADGWALIGTAMDPAGEFAPAGSYSITYNADKTLTFDLTLDEVCVGLEPKMFVDGTFLDKMNAVARAAGSWTKTTTETYNNGDVVSFYFNCAYAGGVSDTKAINYTVGEVTAIDAIEVEAAANVDVVTVLGVVVRHNVPAAEATQGLPAGLYIVGGQKVLVK